MRNVHTLLLGLFFSHICYSQPPQFWFESLTTAEGLPSNYITALLYDAEGFLWIGTDKGLCRFDGKNAEKIPVEGSYIGQILQDKTGIIWIRTDKGMFSMQQGRLEAYTFLKPFILFQADSQVYAVVDRKPLTTYYELLGAKQTPKHIATFRINPNKLPQISQGTLYISAPLFQETTQSPHFKADIPVDTFPSLLPDLQDTLLFPQKKPYKANISKKNWVLWEQNTLRLLPLVHAGEATWEPIYAQNSAAALHKNGEVEILYKNKKLYNIGKKDNLYIECMTFAPDGSLLLGTLGEGIQIWRNETAHLYPLSEKKCYPIAATPHSVLAAMKDELFEVENNKAIPLSIQEKNVSALAKHENYYAIGTFTGFSIYEKKENKFQKIFYDKETAGISGFVFHSLDDFYVSTYGTGIIHYAHLQRSGKINTPASTITLENIFPYSATQFAGLSLSEGLLLFDKQGFSDNINLKNGLLSAATYCFFREKDSLWIGTEGGFQLWYKGQMQQFPLVTGIKGNKVLALFRDKQQRFWVVSNKALHFFDGKKCHVIGSFPLLKNENLNILRAVYQVDSQILWAGTDKYLVSINLGEVATEKYVGKLALSYVMQDSLRLSPQKSYTFPYQTSEIALHFLAPSMSARTCGTIWYQVAEHGQEWKELPADLTLKWEYLPSGTYHIRTKIVNPDGAEGDIAELCVIEILTPFWKKTSFLLFCFILTAILIAGIVWKIAEIRRKKDLKTLEIKHQLQLERERISRDLHDNIGAEITGIIRNIHWLERLNLPQEEKKQFEDISKTASQMMDTLRETIWAANQAAISVEDFSDRLKVFAHKRKGDTVIVFKEKIACDRTLNPTDTLNLYRLCQEAIQNALKHAEATEILVEIESNENQLFKVTISDNGKGFDMQLHYAGHYGLENMRHRAAESGATFVMTSEVGKGTVIVVEK